MSIIVQPLERYTKSAIFPSLQKSSSLYIQQALTLSALQVKKSANVSTPQIKESVLEATQGLSGAKINARDYYWIIIYVSRVTWIAGHNLKLGSLRGGKNVILESNVFLVSSFLIASCLSARINMKTCFSDQRKITHISFQTFHFNAFHPETSPSLALRPETPGASLDSLPVPPFLLQVTRTGQLFFTIATCPLLSLTPLTVLGISTETFRKWGAIRTGW